MYVLPCMFWANGNDLPNCLYKLSLSLSYSSRLRYIQGFKDKITLTTNRVTTFPFIRFRRCSS